MISKTKKTYIFLSNVSYPTATGQRFAALFFVTFVVRALAKVFVDSSRNEEKTLQSTVVVHLYI